MSTRTWHRLMRLGARCGCHQRAERSFFLHGWQLPLCARCTGILLGQLLALLGQLVITPHFAMAVLVVPLAIDGLTQLAGWRESTNGLRLATGLVAGYGYLSVLLALLYLFL